MLKIGTWLLIFAINIPIFAIGSLSVGLTKRMVLRDRRAKLMAFANLLNIRMPAGGFDSILRAQNKLAANREEKIATLSRALTPLADEIASAAPGLGTGYYNRELDAIIAYGPSDLYGDMVGNPIASNHPGREVMATNTALVREGKMVRGEIMNAMMPIFRNGKVEGYIWANELLTDINDQVNPIVRDIIVLTIVCLLIAICCGIVISRRYQTAQNFLVDAINRIRSNPSNSAPLRHDEYQLLCDTLNQVFAENEAKNTRLERDLKQARKITDSLAVMIIVIDAANYEVIYMNELLRNNLSANGTRDMPSEQFCYRALHEIDNVCVDCWKELFYDRDKKLVLDMQSAWVKKRIEPLDREFWTCGRAIKWHDGRAAFFSAMIDLNQPAGVVKPLQKSVPVFANGNPPFAK